MPTIKTLNAAGGVGIDYTTAATWEDFADGEATADQWAECYGTGDLGLLFLSGWVSTATASLYPKIYAAPGHQVTGFNDGPLFGRITITTSDQKFVWLEGIRSISEFASSQIRNALVMRNCVVERVDGLGFQWAFSSASAVTDSLIENCIIRGTSDGLGLNNKGLAGNNITVRNCLLIGGTGFGFDVQDHVSGGSSTQSYNATIQNNVAIAGFGASTANPVVLVSPSNNASDDGTADSYLGGTNNQNNIDTTTAFVDYDNGDYTPKYAGELYRVGTLPPVVDSFNGVPRHVRQDIGPIESEQGYITHLAGGMGLSL